MFAKSRSRYYHSRSNFHKSKNLQGPDPSLNAALMNLPGVSVHKVVSTSTISYCTMNSRHRNDAHSFTQCHRVRRGVGSRRVQFHLRKRRRLRFCRFTMDSCDLYTHGRQQALHKTSQTTKRSRGPCNTVTPKRSFPPAPSRRGPPSVTEPHFILHVGLVVVNSVYRLRSKLRDVLL